VPPPLVPDPAPSGASGRRHRGFLPGPSPARIAARPASSRKSADGKKATLRTASVFINDDEPGLHEDYKRWLEWLAPYDPSPQRYHHNRTGEDNGDAHHKRQVMGREVVVAITNGKLDSGPWEQIFYGEFDGRRDKRVMIKIIGE
jgi:secondary thiamine-phosphate synthase enzyme